jgi:hypothetical protein
MRLCAAICVHTDNQFLEATLESLRQVPIFVFVSSVDWQGVSHDVSETRRIAESRGATVIEGDWPDETSHRRSAYKHLRDDGWNYCLTIDSDEIIEPSLLDKLVSIAGSGLADRVHVEWDTYWKSPEFVIRPREPFKPCVLINLQTVSHVRIREFSGGTPLLVGAEHGIIHHFSYAGTRLFRIGGTTSGRHLTVTRFLGISTQHTLAHINMQSTSCHQPRSQSF